MCMSNNYVQNHVVVYEPYQQIYDDCRLDLLRCSDSS
jgi:hypothetical protein